SLQRLKNSSISADELLNNSNETGGYQLKNNPSSDGNFVIESDYIDQNTKVMVYDLQGRRLFEKDYADKRRISVEANLPAGVYLVAVVNSHNRAALKLEVK
ncbi:MAG TPA: T9SS type A sorting domain-containing protein, partial [Bacteroidales bacterium]|nr:T9SS type A sorting domain-containing protein [Bacteroidales bacterium]